MANPTAPGPADHAAPTSSAAGAAAGRTPPGRDGVSLDEPCPDPVNADNGCLFLGVLSDLTEGPFRALGTGFTDGARAFWRAVNEAGGLGGFDVDLATYTRDTRYDPQLHAEAFAEIAPHVLALAESLGTETTLAIRDDLERLDTVAVAASWWSGWAFDQLVLVTGASYCLAAMEGLDWAASQGDAATVMAVRYDDVYGRDVAAGVRSWAGATGLAADAVTETIVSPNPTPGAQDPAVEALLAAGPDVVVLATGPTEMAEIVGKAATQGFDGLVLGMAPSFDPALLEDADLAQVLGDRYRQVLPALPWGAETEAHKAMATALGGQLPTNEAFVLGWLSQYPLAEAIARAIETGDVSRAGVRAGADGVRTDYAGGLPGRRFSGQGSPPATRGAVIARPSVEAPLGVVVERGYETGPTARSHEYRAPCVAAP